MGELTQSWSRNPRSIVALILLLDQFSRFVLCRVRFITVQTFALRVAARCCCQTASPCRWDCLTVLKFFVCVFCPKALTRDDLASRESHFREHGQVIPSRPSYDNKNGHHFFHHPVPKGAQRPAVLLRAHRGGGFAASVQSVFVVLHLRRGNTLFTTVCRHPQPSDKISFAGSFW